MCTHHIDWSENLYWKQTGEPWFVDHGLFEIFTSDFTTVGFRLPAGPVDFNKNSNIIMMIISTIRILM